MADTPIIYDMGPYELNTLPPFQILDGMKLGEITMGLDNLIDCFQNGVSNDSQREAAVAFVMQTRERMKILSKLRKDLEPMPTTQRFFMVSEAMKAEARKKMGVAEFQHMDEKISLNTDRRHVITLECVTKDGRQLWMQSTN